MKKLLTFFILSLFFASAMILAANEQRWINIHVVERENNTKVDVHLPLSLVSVALNSIQTKQLHNGVLKLDLKNVNIDFQKLWSELRKYDNTDFVKISSDKENVLVSRKSNKIIINILERSKNKKSSSPSKVTIKIPVKLIDSLSINEKKEIDLKSFIEALATIPAGNLVEVHDKDTNVRIWIE